MLLKTGRGWDVVDARNFFSIFLVHDENNDHFTLKSCQWFLSDLSKIIDFNMAIVKSEMNEERILFKFQQQKSVLMTDTFHRSNRII